MIVRYKRYVRCSEDLPIIGGFGADVRMAETTLTFGEYRFNGVVDTLPTEITIVNGFPLYDTTWTVDYEDMDIGHHAFTFIGSDTGNTYVIEFLLTQCLPAIESCGTNERVIKWLNKEGGWSSMIFAGKSTYEVEIEDYESHIDANEIKRVSKQGEIRQAELLTTGNVPEHVGALIESLRYSTQVYLITDNEDLITYNQIPVNVVRESFTVKKTGQKRFEYTCRVIYGANINTQRG